MKLNLPTTNKTIATGFVMTLPSPQRVPRGNEGLEAFSVHGEEQPDGRQTRRRDYQPTLEKPGPRVH